MCYQYFTQQNIPELKTTLQPLTSLKGNEVGASFSKDGKWLIYSHQVDLTSPLHLYIKSIQNNQIIQLTDNALNISAPAISSQSNKIAYFEKNYQQCQLKLMTLNKQMQPLTTTKLASCDPGVHFSTLTWSIDDKKLIYTDRKSDQHPYLIQQLTLDTGRIQSLSQLPDSHYGDYAIALSPNGKKLAFLRSKYWDNSELYLMDMTTLAIEKVWQFDFLLWSVSFLDDQSLIYSDGKSPGNLHQLNLTQQKVKHLYSSTGFLFNAKPAYKQGDIIYNQINIEVDLWRINLPVKNKNSAFIAQINSSSIDEKPVISDNSEALAFLSNRLGELNLWIKNTEKLFPIKSIDTKERLDSYFWLADNKRIIVETGTNKLLIVDTEKDITSIIKTVNNIAVHPSRSQNSRWLYYSSDKNGDWQIWRQLIDEPSEPQLITVTGGYSAKESFDGKNLIYTKYRQAGLWQLNLTSGQESLLIDDLHRRTQFKIGKESIYFSRKNNGMKQIGQYGLSDKQETLIFEMPATQQMEYDVNKSCTRLLYSAWFGDSDIMLLKK